MPHATALKGIKNTCRKASQSAITAPTTAVGQHGIASSFELTIGRIFARMGAPSSAVFLIEWVILERAGECERFGTDSTRRLIILLPPLGVSTEVYGKK